MGVLNPETKSLRIQDVVLVKQQVSEMHVDLDMEWWADHQVELFEKEKIQPWQTSVWIHTHPSGINEPSGVDEQTMRETFEMLLEFPEDFVMHEVNPLAMYRNFPITRVAESRGLLGPMLEGRNAWLAEDKPEYHFWTALRDTRHF